MKRYYLFNETRNALESKTMKATFTCLNCRAVVTEPVKHPIEIEVIKALGAACAKCCRKAYSK